MKKIETQESINKKKQRNNLIIAIIMVVLIGVSSLGYAIMSRTDSSTTTNVKYGNLEFVRSNDFWITNINNKIYYFNNLPNEVENVSVSGNIKLDDFYGKVVYFVNSNDAVRTLNIFDGIALRSQEACLANTTCSEPTFAKKTCSDNVIIFDAASDETKIEKQDNCIFLRGNSFEAVDKLVYRFFNIA
jgi:hypothetical protein